jgi:hypothetical protein
MRAANEWRHGLGLLLAASLALMGCTRAPARDPLLLPGQLAGPPEAQSDQPPPLSPLVEYAVVYVPDGEALPVREQAGPSGREIAQLQPDERPLRVTGRTSMLGSSMWVEIELSSGGTGWIRAWNLTEARTPAQACADPRLAAALDAFMSAAEDRDAEALRRTVSPWHGLAVRLDARGGEVLTAPIAVGTLTAGEAQLDWLTRPEAGLATEGQFVSDVIEPLRAVVASQSPVCAQLPSGETAVVPEWPREYRNLNYLAFHEPAAPTGSEFGWDTWAVGFEYVGGAPYVAVIIHYQGEI